jgi:hypothetical protein
MTSMISHFYHAVAKIGLYDLNRALWYAAASAKENKIKALIDAGADMYGNHDAVLLASTLYGGAKAEKAMLEAGADKCRLEEARRRSWAIVNRGYRHIDCP